MTRRPARSLNSLTMDLFRDWQKRFYTTQLTRPSNSQLYASHSKPLSRRYHPRSDNARSRLRIVNENICLQSYDLVYRRAIPRSRRRIRDSKFAIKRKRGVISKYLFRNFRTEINFITINDTTPASKFLAPSVPAIRGDTTPSHR